MKTFADGGSAVDHRSHGGRRKELAAAAGVREEELLDFSANINPLGPPEWIAEAVREGARGLAFYPDPEATKARDAASERYGLPADRFLFADGADSLIFSLPLAVGAASCVVPTPSYSGYLRAAARRGVKPLRPALEASESFFPGSRGFLSRLEGCLASAARPSLVFLGSPNNPAGGTIPEEAALDLARRFPGAVFAVDESFAELAGTDRGLIGAAAPNLVVLRSLTKTYAVPGARVGFASGSPELLAALRAQLPAWPLSTFAEAIAVRALEDRDFTARSRSYLVGAEAEFVSGLGAVEGLRVYRSGANFLLLELSSEEEGGAVSEALLRSGIAVRRFSAAEGLDGRYMRVAVRGPGENRRFLAAFRRALGASGADPAGGEA